MGVSNGRLPTGGYYPLAFLSGIGAQGGCCPMVAWHRITACFMRGGEIVFCFIVMAYYLW
jgi:hypothetical protein